MGKLKLFFIIFLSMQYAAKAQTAMGVEVGISNSYLNTNISNRASTAINYNIGYTINIPFQYRINHWLYIETAPGITQKNYSINRTDSFAGIYQNLRNTYLQIPLAMKFVYGKRLKVFADAGGYWGYWLSGRVIGNIPNILGLNSNDMLEDVNYNEKYEFNSQKDNRIEWGWVAGIGVQYKLTPKNIVIISCRDYQALTNQQKTYSINGVPQYNQTFTFSLGIMKSFK